MFFVSGEKKDVLKHSKLQETGYACFLLQGIMGRYTLSLCEMKTNKRLIFGE